MTDSKAIYGLAKSESRQSSQCLYVRSDEIGVKRDQWPMSSSEKTDIIKPDLSLWRGQHSFTVNHVPNKSIIE